MKKTIVIAALVSAIGQCITGYAKASTNLQYTFGYTDAHTTTQMQYELHIKTEEL